MEKKPAVMPSELKEQQFKKLELIYQLVLRMKATLLGDKNTMFDWLHYGNCIQNVIENMSDIVAVYNEWIKQEYIKDQIYYVKKYLRTGTGIFSFVEQKQISPVAFMDNFNTDPPYFMAMARYELYEGETMLAAFDSGDTELF